MLPLIQRHPMVHHSQTYTASPPLFMPGHYHHHHQQQQQQHQQQQHHHHQQQQQQQQPPPPQPPPLPLHQHPYGNSSDANVNARSFPTPPTSGFVPRSAVPLRLSRPAVPSVPLHTSPNARLAPHQFVENGEHRLRRKTPNGTIDAGYDGNPSHLASGPPPFKHMVLPTSSKPVPFAGPSQNASRSSLYPVASSADRWSYSSSFSFHTPDGPSLLPLDSNVLPPGSTLHVNSQDLATALALDCAPSGPVATHQVYNNLPRVPTALQPIHQQSPSPALFHNGAMLPAAIWPEANLSSYSYTFRPSPYQNQFNTQAIHHHGSDAFVAPFSAMSLRSGFEPHQASIQVPSQKLESLTLESTAFKPSESRVQGIPSPVRFREKVLTHAHRSYLELLAYQHQTKKSPHRSVGPRTSSRMVIFPKLPRSSSYSSSVFATQHSQEELDFADIRRGNLSTCPESELHPVAHGQLNRNHHLRGPRAHNPAPYNSLGTDNSLRASDPSHAVRERVLVTPLTSAKAAIDMLTNLCEQSDWKWIDGMLLGGCLHYGLERYEQSLEWFQRIVSLDSGHVEAMSNMAASLYCLGRCEEAEKHWMRAVRRQPNYLEAVEHLVHLLCANNRSKEAVEIIDFVQRSLRLPNNSPRNNTGNEARIGSTHTPWDSGIPRIASQSALISDSERAEEFEAPGFGLSGYSVPASENGRVIALIHAKGNMLYALKDIDQASDAFEEAVLISTGKSLQCIRSLISRIQSVLSNPLSTNRIHTLSSAPLLLPPDEARQTARLVFTTTGELPGLRYVPEGMPKKSAISTTSNSLLSLAKIFQDAMSNGGAYPKLLRQPPGVGDILALYYLSLSLSESPSTANNVGILLASIQHTRAASPNRTSESLPTPIAGITPGSGLALALAYYNYGLGLDSKHVHLHTNLGSLLKDIGQLDLAIQMYERAVACDGTFDIALTNLANAVKDRGRISDAIMYYKRAVNSNPQFAEAVCGLSTALNSVCDWRGRGGVLLDHGRYDRWHVNDDGMLKDAREEGLGSGLMKKVVAIVSKQLADSSQWGMGILQNGELDVLVRQLRTCVGGELGNGIDVEAELRNWAGRPWEGSRLIRLIERATKVMMRRWYIDQFVTGHSSTSDYVRLKLPAQLPVPAAPTVLPFHTFTCPLSAKDIRMISQRNAARIACSTLRSPWLPTTVYPPPPPPSSHLNIGYVSSDFNNHPLAHLMQSVFGFHDPQRVKAICYATTASDRSVHRQQIEHEAPVFRDVSGWSSEQIVQQIVNDGIHILVNLNGYTRGARNEVFAARPAPIQMSFMGFAGTLGAEWCDYLLADETAIPPSTLRPPRSNLGLDDVFRDEEFTDAEDWVYSENIIFCRNTFFCCDHAQSCEAEETTITWEDELRRRWKMRRELFPNLSDNTVIMGNFNQLYKIDPSTFRTWLRILSNVPKAVLWLLRFPELGESNLRKTAKAWAGEEVANRIIFTDVAPKQQHISRARVCDIFLDTPECNAHTTAADVLWSSTPLLTLPRYPYKMCSRMAASILKGALPKNAEGARAAQELIASDDAEYEAFATRLASGLSYERTNEAYCEGRGRLAELRKILFEAKWTCALFDTHRWVSDLESAYEEAWRRWVTGESGDIHL
ncbi:glycosyl transferase family 41-domain-containing protein [Xylaria bambusicola]|uniref:glycosyl transferase family 41-domain-containing protein n=1 Tax=Xylaria bambusicola TaxID=326684 RepID=UPI0020073AB7|nr:glycosyl transferase family 41-domain-containing protein [Xylaria bambusicola]KAI0515337.1 glycosyl transferase family 41-domain-containing protein [Xylaria bambusicola]